MIARVSKVNRLIIETPDRNSCDVFRKCPPEDDSTGHTVLSVVVGPDEYRSGELRTITVTLDTPVTGAPLEVQFVAPAGVDNQPQTIIVAVQPGQTVGVASPQAFRAPSAMFSGVLLGYPANGLPANPRIDAMPEVTPFAAPVRYQVADITVDNDEVLIGENVTYTVTLDHANAMSVPINVSVSASPDQEPVSGAVVSIAPGQTQGSVTVSFNAAGVMTGNLSSPPPQLETSGAVMPEVLVIDPVFNIGSYNPSNPLVIAHSGGALLSPEYTIEAYNRSVSDGILAMEADAHLLSDGAVANWHDDTVDVRTTGTGPVSGFNTAGWAALNIDAGVWFGGGFGNTMHPIRIQQLIDAHGTDILYIVEIKAEGADPEVVDLLTDNDIPVRQTLIVSFRLTDLLGPKAAGYQVGYTTSTATPTEISDAQAAQVDWIGVSLAMSDTDMNTWRNAGFKLLPYTVNRRFDLARVTALQASGYFSDDPLYVAGDSALRTADNFSAQAWDHGMISHLGFWSAVARGRFTAPNYWGFPANTAEFNSVLQGYLSPIADEEFVLDFSVTFDAANAGDQTRWASVFIGKNDKAFANVSPAPLPEDEGLHFIMPKNGALHIYSRETTGTTIRANVATTAIADGAEAHYRITLGPTSVTLQRLNAAHGTVTHTATWATTDPDLRGTYVHFCRAGLACRYRNVTVTP